MRRKLATAAATVLVGVGVLSGAGGAVAAEPSGPVLSFVGYQGGDDALLAVDTATGRQWTIAPGFTQDASWSPDGSRIAWLAYDEDYLGHVQVAAADGTGREQLDADGDSRALTWGADGTLAWLHRSTWNPTDCTLTDRLARPEVVLQAADGTRRVLGTAAPTARDLRFSPDGRTVAWREDGGDPCAAATSQLVLADVATGTQTVVAGAEDTSGIAFSPDSSTIASTRRTDEGGDVVLVDVATRAARQVRTVDTGEEFAQFVHDGSALAVVRSLGTEDRFAVVGLDGTLLQDVAKAPTLVEDVVASTDGISLLAAGSDVFPTASDDVGVVEPGVWRQPLDGAAATRLSDDGSLAGADLAVAHWSSPAPVVPRGTRPSR